jgi:hypothetical protein
MVLAQPRHHVNNVVSYLNFSNGLHSHFDPGLQYLLQYMKWLPIFYGGVPPDTMFLMSLLEILWLWKVFDCEQG